MKQNSGQVFTLAIKNGGFTHYGKAVANSTPACFSVGAYCNTPLRNIRPEIFRLRMMEDQGRDGGFGVHHVAVGELRGRIDQHPWHWENSQTPIHLKVRGYFSISIPAFRKMAYSGPPRIPAGRPRESEGG